MIHVRIVRARPDCDDIPMPQYATEHSAGMDICAAVEGERVIETGAITLIPTSFAIELPDGFEAQVRSRSGLALKHGMTVLNSPGTIDADFRGEVQVILMNLGAAPFTVRRGDRIAQLVVGKYERVRWEPVETLASSERGAGGFGHSGITPRNPAGTSHD